MYLLVLALCCCAACESVEREEEETVMTETTAEDLDATAQVEHGKYLISIMGCNDCHTPKKMTEQGPVPDMALFLSGHPKDSELPEIDPTQIEPGKWLLFNSGLTAAVGPWGISYAANLTPHQTGLGSWTYDHFAKALREGKHKGLDGGRMILPPMPWQEFRNMKEADLQAIFAYLQSIEPIDNLVPEPVPPTDI